MKIIRIVGARPQFMQVPTLHAALEARGVDQLLVHTGQHYDDNMSRVFFNELNLPEPDFHLEVGSHSAGTQTAIMIKKIEDMLLEHTPDMIVIDGDTNSTAAAALASAKLGIPVAHVESGVRCGIFYQAEEINRKLTDHLSELLFAPSPSGMKGLHREGLSDRAIESGDLMLDTFLSNEARHNHAAAESMTEGFETYILATLHRQETTSDYSTLEPYLVALADHPYDVIFPTHPRLKKLIDKFSANRPDHNIRFVPPVGYLTMMALLAKADIIVTDSGGLTREGPFSGKPVILAAEATAWTDLVDAGCVVKWNPFDSSLKSAQALCKPIDRSTVHKMFGSGHAAERIANEIVNF